MAQGHEGGAYARLDKTENYVGQALTNLGNVAFRDRQFKQEQADKVQSQKAAQAKALQDEANAVKIPDLKTVTSLNSNLERLKTKTASDIAGKVVAIKNEINNTNDRSKVSDLQAKLSQANLAFDTLNDFSTKVNDNIKYLVDNKDKIDPDSYDEQMAKYTMAAKGYGQIRLDDNMHPIFDATDENGNVLKEEGSANKSLSDFFVNNAQNLMLKSTFNDDVDKVVDKIGKKETVNDLGEKTYTKVRPSPEAIATAKETLFNELLNKKNNVYRVSKDNNIKSNDTEGLRAIVNKTIDSKLDFTTKNQINTAQENFNLRKKELEEAKTKISSAPVTENYIDQTSKNKIVDHKNYLPNQLTFGTQTQKPFKNLGGSLSDLNNGFVVGINKKINGKNKDQYLITGSSLKNKNIKYKGRDVNTYELSLKADAGDVEAQSILSQQGADIYNTFTRTITRTELNSIANGIGLQDYKDVDSRINKLNPKQKVSTPVKAEKTEKIKAGAVIDGYKFLGGDPNNYKSWKKI